MYNHAPENYICPICLGAKGVENEDTWIKQADIVYRDELVTAFIGTKFIKNNPGYPIVVPNDHFENFYDMPDEIVSHLMVVSKRIAIAVKKARNCDGIKILQNNEPSADQHAFHYHLHVIPTFTDDKLYENINNTRISEPEERVSYVEDLRKVLD